MAVERLVHGLRVEVRRKSRPQNVAMRLDLLAEFLVGALAGCECKSGALDNRTLQRRSRGRRLARSAWHSLRHRAGYVELDEVADALGLSKHTTVVDAGNKVSFAPRKCQARAVLAS